MKTLLHPVYFPNIVTFAAVARHGTIWEAYDNFQKQTYRNRCHICTDRGMHMLNIPIKHIGGNEGRQLYVDVVIDHTAPWQKQHWKTLETAYRSSPYFEFYEDRLRPLFEEPIKFLYQFNLKTIHVAGDCLGIEIPNEKTSVYEPNPLEVTDGRFLAEAKKPFAIDQKRYSQVFGERHGFVGNLSILDLLFNEGTNALQYLRNQSTDYL